MQLQSSIKQVLALRCVRLICNAHPPKIAIAAVVYPKVCNS